MRKNWCNLNYRFPAHCCGVLILILSVNARAAAQDNVAKTHCPQANTFSIVACDPESGDLGIAVASKILGVGSIVPWAKADVGAIATQSLANTAYGPEGLALLQTGRDAKETLQLLIDADTGRDDRQVGVVDAKGNVAAFTGVKCQGWTGDLQGDHYTVQGNLLSGEKVLQEMAAAYDQARQTEQSELADWILAALTAGEAAGGDKRGKQSAAILVVRSRAGYLGNDRYVDLRVEDHAEPVTELARLLATHKEAFKWPHDHKPHRRPKTSEDDVAATAAATDGATAKYPEPTAGDYLIRDFHFRSGETLAEVQLHYLTLGKPQSDATGTVRNAILILHGTTGSSEQFLRPEFANELYGVGQPFDVSRYYIIIPDNIGHGKSTKPSDSLHGRFPKYGYLDMIDAQHRLLVEGLGVDHVRLIFGTSMGGMHAWLWGQLHPDFMDALMPMASLPGQIAGRNRAWRRIIIDAVRTDPSWNNGEYQSQPPGLRTAVAMLYFMSRNSVLRLREGSTLSEADHALDAYLAERLDNYDANDVLYAFAASEDYNPAPGLDKIKAPLLAINFADDLINPPELDVLERGICRVARGRAVVIPMTEKSVGHGTHTSAAVWKDHLIEFLKRSEPD